MKNPKKQGRSELLNIPHTTLTCDAKIFEYKTVGSAGADIYANENISISPNQTVGVKTGIAIQLPKGYELQIRSRSGLALKNSIFCLNSPGTIDEDYFDEIRVILHNASSVSFEVKKGDRIAQAVLCPIYKGHYVKVEKLDKSGDRGGGFGSTGLH